MKYSVNPLTCGRCVRSITDALHAIDPTAKIQTDLATGTVEIEGAFDPSTVVATLAGIGYQAIPATAGTELGGGSCCGTCHT